MTNLSPARILATLPAAERSTLLDGFSEKDLETLHYEGNFGPARNN